MRGLVRVSNHAATQAQARFPGEFPNGHAGRCRQIVHEVSQAVDDHRTALSSPRWALRAGTTTRSSVVHEHKRGGTVHRSRRYAWTADRRRLYIITRGPQVTVVITTIGPFQAAGEEAA